VDFNNKNDVILNSDRRENLKNYTLKLILNTEQRSVLSWMKYFICTVEEFELAHVPLTDTQNSLAHHRSID
jgi:SRSO17 transposase